MNETYITLSLPWAEIKGGHIEVINYQNKTMRLPRFYKDGRELCGLSEGIVYVPIWLFNANFDEAKKDDEDFFDEYLRKDRDNFDFSPPREPAFHTEPYAFQRDLTLAFAKKRIGALFLDMGMGKTKIALDVMYAKGVERLVVICPPTLILTWKSEIEKHRPEFIGKTEIVSIGGFSTTNAPKRAAKVQALLGETDHEKRGIIVDESSLIKNDEAKRTQYVLALEKTAMHKLILSGLPVSKNIGDLWTQMRFLDKEALPFYSFNDFLIACAVFRETRIRGKREIIIDDAKNVPFLMREINDYAVQGNKTDFIDLPEKTKTELKVKLNTKETEAYEAEKERVLRGENKDEGAIDYAKEKLNTNVILGLFTKLNHIAADCAAKIEAITEQVSFSNSEHILVFCAFLSQVEALQKKISKAYAFTGAEKNLDEWRKNGGVLLLTYGAGALGLTLNEADTVFFASGVFDFAQMEQAAARNYRIGQTKKCTYIYVKSDAKIENFIYDNLEKKGKLVAAINKELQLFNTEKEQKEWLYAKL